MEVLYNTVEEQALDAIMTAVQLLEGGSQCFHQHRHSGETGRGTGINKNDTRHMSTERTNLTSPQTGHIASLATPPIVPEDLANGGDPSTSSARSSSGLGRNEVFPISGAGDSTQTYLGPVSGISAEGPVCDENATATGTVPVPLFVQRMADGISNFDEDDDDPLSGQTSTQPAAGTKRKTSRTGSRISVMVVKSNGKEQDRQKRIKARNIYHAQMSRRRRRFRQAVLEQETAWLQRDISRLEADIRCLSEEIDVFSDVLMNHSCPDVISDL
ncbi:uncharacterized protein [Haliotis asinina]|uniref:uncharacterized protein n=1 Tax=Haliotis asinina TaxID=109174 RepID=UPI0035321368